MKKSGLKRRGLMFVLSSPSGAGKTTITRALLEKNPEATISISATTRARRAGEAHGKDYLFLDMAQFNQMVSDDQMLEHAPLKRPLKLVKMLFLILTGKARSN